MNKPPASDRNSAMRRLQDACAQMSSTGPGSRNQTFNSLAFAMGRLVSPDHRRSDSA